MKKYELVKDDFKSIGSKLTLYRIRALKDFEDIKAGDLGGYIEKEDNLSQEGNSWIYYDAYVYGNASVTDNAKIYNGAVIEGNCKITDNVQIHGMVHLNGSM